MATINNPYSGLNPYMGTGQRESTGQSLANIVTASLGAYAKVQEIDKHYTEQEKQKLEKDENIMYLGEKLEAEKKWNEFNSVNRKASEQKEFIFNMFTEENKSMFTNEKFKIGYDSLKQDYIGLANKKQQRENTQLVNNTIDNFSGVIKTKEEFELTLSSLRELDPNTRASSLFNAVYGKAEDDLLNRFKNDTASMLKMSNDEIAKSVLGEVWEYTEDSAYKTKINSIIKSYKNGTSSDISDSLVLINNSEKKLSSGENIDDNTYNSTLNAYDIKIATSTGRSRTQAITKKKEFINKKEDMSELRTTIQSTYDKKFVDTLRVGYKSLAQQEVGGVIDSIGKELDAMLTSTLPSSNGGVLNKEAIHRATVNTASKFNSLGVQSNHLQTITDSIVKNKAIEATNPDDYMAHILSYDALLEFDNTKNDADRFRLATVRLAYDQGKEKGLSSEEILNNMRTAKNLAYKRNKTDKYQARLDDMFKKVKPAVEGKSGFFDFLMPNSAILFETESALKSIANSQGNMFGSESDLRKWLEEKTVDTISLMDNVTEWNEPSRIYIPDESTAGDVIKGLDFFISNKKTTSGDIDDYYIYSIPSTDPSDGDIVLERNGSKGQERYIITGEQIKKLSAFDKTVFDNIANMVKQNLLGDR